GPNLGERVGDLVVAEGGRAAAATGAVEREEDQHRVAAHVVVHVAPVRVADIDYAVGSAAIARVREPDRPGQVRGRKREETPFRDQQLDLGRGQQGADVQAGRELEEATGDLREGRRSAHQRQGDRG